MSTKARSVCPYCFKEGRRTVLTRETGYSIELALKSFDAKRRPFQRNLTKVCLVHGQQYIRRMAGLVEPDDTQMAML